MRHFFFLFVLLLTSCGQHTAVIPTLKPYRMDVQQGNVVTPKMMMQLRPGMTKSQVRFIMGTPLLTDPFHADRWDYFYQMRKEGRIIEQRRVILEFEADELKRVRGDVVPVGSDPNAMTTEPGKAEPRSIPPKKEEKSWVDKLKFWKQDEPAQSNPSQPKAAPASMPQTPTEALPEEKPSGEALPAIAPAAEPAALPPLTAPEPALPAAPQPEVAPEKLKPAPAASQAQSGAKQKSVADVPVQDSPAPPKSAVKPQPEAAPKTKPAGKVAPKSEARTIPKTPPQPPEDLPPEEAPDFFEKMLEKIGF